MTLIHGLDITGKRVPFKVNPDGSPASTSGGLNTALVYRALSAMLLLQDPTPSPANQAIIDELDANS